MFNYLLFFNIDQWTFELVMGYDNFLDKRA